MNADVGGGSGTAPAEPLTPGELLRQERQRRARSVQQAAEDLRLDPWIIEAIESNRFAALGAPVYARGHLRKYAALLGLSPDIVVKRYEALQDTPAVPTPIPVTLVSPVGRERPSMRVPGWILGTIAAVAVAWLASELFRAGDEAVTPVPEPEAEVPAAPEPQTPIVDAAPAKPPAAADVATPAPAEAPGAIRLQLEFTEPSWTEVYDATGNRLMFDMGEPGRVRIVSGVPPIRVTLGLASAVSARVNDRPIVIPRRGGRDAAKFVVDAAGAVRADRAVQAQRDEVVVE